MSGYAWPSGYSNLPPAPLPPHPNSAYHQQSPPPPQHQHYYSSPPPPPPPVDYYAPRPPPPSSNYADPYRSNLEEMIAHDPNVFRRHFLDHLSTLTFNSRPIINNLSILARHHASRMSTIIAQCLEDHLRVCDPSIRLPALYLLDSIAKNTGHPYIHLFSRFIERTFLTMYHDAHQAIRVKMEELLGTWRTGGEGHSELFRAPDEVQHGRIQHNIESVLFGSGGRGGGMAGGGSSNSYLSGVKQLPSGATESERSDVLFDVRRILALREDQAVAEPNDGENNGQIVSLKQLENLICSTQLSSEQVYQIRVQLAAIVQPPTLPNERQKSAAVMELTASLAPIVVSPSHTTAFSPPFFPSPAPQHQHQQYQQQQLLPPIPPARTVSPLPSPIATLPPAVVPHSRSSLVTALTGIDPTLLAQLQGLAGGRLDELLAATPPPQLLGGTSTRSPMLRSATPVSFVKKEEMGVQPFLAGEPIKKEQKPRVMEEEKDGWEEEYDRAIGALGIGLTNVEILKSRPEIISFLYARLGLQCKQCGLRYFDSPAGQRKMDVHLDWHFNHKRRIREGAARTQGRSWLVEEGEWYRSDASTSDTLLDPSLSSTSASASINTTTTVIDRATLMKKKVTAPTEPERASRPCPICKEKFKTDWHEGEEEWVYWNAVQVEGTIYHATCHAEAVSARLSARLRNTTDRATTTTRESTPVLAVSKMEEEIVTKKEEEEDGEQSSTRRESPNGRKRTVEDDHHIGAGLSNGGEEEIERGGGSPSEFKRVKREE